MKCQTEILTFQFDIFRCDWWSHQNYKAAESVISMIVHVFISICVYKQYYLTRLPGALPQPIFNDIIVSIYWIGFCPALYEVWPRNRIPLFMGLLILSPTIGQCSFMKVILHVYHWSESSHSPNLDICYKQKWASWNKGWNLYNKRLAPNNRFW